MQFLLTMSSLFKMLIPAVLLLGAGVYGFRKYIGEERWQMGKSRLMLSLPLFGKIIADLEMCRYIRTLAIMIANHVEIIRTVKIAEKIIHNPVIGNTFHGLSDKIKGGAKLSAALKDNPYVPGEMVPMLRVGEESGSVGEMLKNIADNLEGGTRLKIKRLLSLFEPAVIVFLAAVVLIVVASIFMAMMDLNAINSQGGPRL
jgi:general secretion pathway protein F